MKLSKGLLMTALITGTLASASAYAAEENIAEFTLDPMIVTATRTEKRDVDVAASTEVITAEKLAETGASNLYEAMQYVPGLAIQAYGPRGLSMGNMTNKIIMRGNGNGTLVLVNGIPLNIRGTYDLNDIPVENVEKVEVVRGGGSVLYGSEATGGVINIITKKQKSNFVKVAVGNKGQQEYSGSFQVENLGFSYKFSDMDTIYGVSENKDFKGPKSHNFDLNYKFNDRLSLQASRNTSKYNYTNNADKQTKMGSKYTNTPANKAVQDVKRNNVQLTYQDKSFKATAYYLDRNREKEQDAYQTDKHAAGKYSYDDEKSYNYGFDAQKTWEVKDANALIGASFLRENYNTKTDAYAFEGSSWNHKSNGVSGTNGTVTRNNFSLYGQYDRKLNNADSIVVSARESWTTGGPNDLNYTNFSSQGQYIHKLNDNESLYASVGQSFKMPSLHQIYNKAKNGAVADALKPQKGMHYELGWKKDISETEKLRVALFAMRIKDNISPTIDSAKDNVTYSNEDLKNQGIEISFTSAASKGFGYNLSASYSNPKTRGTKDNVSYGWQDDYSKFDAKVGLTYKIGKFKSALNASYLADRKTYSASVKSGKVTITEAEAKPYLLTNLNLEYAPTKAVSFYASMNNIFDRKDVTYFSSSSEYYAAPYTYMIGMKYSF